MQERIINKLNHIHMRYVAGYHWMVFPHFFPVKTEKEDSVICWKCNRSSRSRCSFLQLCVLLSNACLCTRIYL